MLITFEGPDGAGKSTALTGVAEFLRGLGNEVVVTREPGAGEFGQRIRTILLEEGHLGSKVELLLFLADRANHVETLVRPALERNAIVLCDRFTDSTVVYQGHARGLDTEAIHTFNDFATGGLTPDITLLFDLEPEIGLSRIKKGDRIDRESLEFHHRVRVGFLREAHKEPRRWVTIDASEPQDVVLKEVLRIVTERISESVPS